MATKPAFRQTFGYLHSEVLKWFPGHMAKGMRMMQQKLRSVDGVIEIHDARIPLSGRNKMFRDKINFVRPHVLVLNKSDLADLSRKSLIESHLRDVEKVHEVFFTDSLQDADNNVKHVIPAMVEVIKSNPRYDPVNPNGYILMVIGVPNVGKSSFINVVRRMYTRKGGKAAPVGALPGHTRAVQALVHVSERPKVSLIDTPGIANPSMPDVDQGMKLALCHIMQDYVVGEDRMVDYLLYWLNKRGDFRYVDQLKIEKPTDYVGELLVKYAVHMNMYSTKKPIDGGPGWVKQPDVLAAAKKIMLDVRTGKMGKFMFDDDLLDRLDGSQTYSHPDHAESEVMRQQAA